MSEAHKDDSIISASPLVPKSECTLSHRIVLRDLGDQYVVHMQVFPDEGNPYFHLGNYVPKKDDGALARVWEHFERRARLTLNLPPPPDIQQVAGVAQEIIETLLPDDIHDRADQIRDDYQLESDIDTFEHLTGKTLWDRNAGEGADHVDDEDEDEEDE